jgi:tRNA (guanine9-N1)-methyltransferase
MEAEERPRKLQKRDHDDESIDLQQHNNTENNEPLMLGAPNENGAVDGTTNSALSIEASSEGQHGNGNGHKEKEDGNGTTDTAPLSKRQQKKLRRMQQWEEQKDERRLKRKEKKAQQRDRRREERKQHEEEENKNGNEQEQQQKQKQNKQQKLQEQNKPRVLLPVTLVIDCGWDNLMHDTERKSLATQITRAYSDNYKAFFKSHLIISSFDKLLKERFDTVLGKAHESWRGVRFMQEDFAYAAEQAKGWMTGPRGGRLAGVFTPKDDSPPSPENGEIIYLSSDSPNTLTELKPYSTYIIGGLVDKNRHKGVCYQKATELGIKTAKLPIGDYLRMASRPVLATNHVIEIMVKWLELGDWGEAFMKVIPQRKGGTLKTAKAEEEDVEDVEHELEGDAAAIVEDDAEAEAVAVADES